MGAEHKKIAKIPNNEKGTNLLVEDRIIDS